jgi:hypothetical protein
MLWNRLSGVYSRSHNAVIRVFDEPGNVIETHEHAGRFSQTAKIDVGWATTSD